MNQVVNVEWGSFRPPQIELTPYDICFNNETWNYYDQVRPSEKWEVWSL